MIYWADLFMGFTTGFVVIWNLRRRVIREPRAVAEYYVRYGTFWPDFLSSLPTIAEVCISMMCARQALRVWAWILPLPMQACEATLFEAAGYLQSYQKLRKSADWAMPIGCAVGAAL